MELRTRRWLYSFFSVWVGGQLIWNAWLYFLPEHTTPANYWFNVYYGSTSLIIGIVALVVIYRQHQRGAVTSALTYLSIGSLCNGLGLWIWGYYNLFTHVEIPYPSPAEALFLVFPFLLAFGTIKLLRFYAEKISWWVIIEGAILTIISSAPIFYYFILPNLGPDLPFITRFITITIPLEDALLIGIVYVMLRVGRGKLKNHFPLYVIAYLFLILGDFVFQYRAAVGIYWNGDIADTLYVLNAFFFSLAIIGTLGTYGQSSEMSLVADINEHPFSENTAPLLDKK